MPPKRIAIYVAALAMAGLLLALSRDFGHQRQQPFEPREDTASTVELNGSEPMIRRKVQLESAPRSSAPERSPDQELTPSAKGLAQYRPTIENPRLRTHPGRLARQFQLVAQAAENRNRPIDRHLRMLPEEWDDFGELADAYIASLPDIDAARSPVVVRILERKKAAGEFEEYPNPSHETDPERRAELRATWARASKARSRDEIVISGGTAAENYVVRILPSEEPELAKVYERWNHQRDRLLNAIGDRFAHRVPFRPR